MNKIELANKSYEKSCMKYIDLFCKKQNIEFSYWCGLENGVGSIACFIDQYFFDLSDIILDLNKKCEKGLIMEWQDKGLLTTECINYNSYVMGLRYKK